ncbi:hypothetical protein LAWASA_1584 [Lawsonibacter asaccharolyticus]|nr:hypothetical protein LAWASA_1584 [Lawsonibacter asaccharolyticus]
MGAILRLGWGEEDPSSVTACAVTPSPRRGEGFGGGSGSRPYGMPSVFARPCGTSQVREWRAGPASCVKAGTKTAGKTSVSPARVSG